jgi:hypothetical protein
MNAKDFRIGNLFIDKYSKQIIPILEILRSGNIVFDFECMGVWQAEPIPLNEDLLLKFGAELDRGIYRFSKLKGYFNLLNLKGDLFYEYNIHQVQMCKIKYVHELQNLFFAITGTELSLTVLGFALLRKSKPKV